MDETFKLVCQRIHKVLHYDGKGIKVNGEPHPVQTGSNGCRYIKYDKKIFIVQDPHRKGVLARRAAAGERITRIIRSAQPWGFITDKDGEVEIVDPLDGK